MKLKTRLVVAFLTVVILPVILSGSVIFAVGKYQMNCIEKTYGISGTSVESLSNSIKTLGQLTMEPYRELCNEIDRTPQKMEDAAFLEKINQELEEKKSYLDVYKRQERHCLRYLVLYLRDCLRLKVSQVQQHISY